MTEDDADRGAVVKSRVVGGGGGGGVVAGSDESLFVHGRRRLER